jgi:hypothetical protein
MRKMEAVRYLRALSAVVAVVLCAGAAAATAATPRPAAARTCALQICYSSFDCHCGLYIHCQIASGAPNGVCIS